MKSKAPSILKDGISRRQMLKTSTAGALFAATSLAMPAIGRSATLEDTLVFVSNGGNTQRIFEDEIWPPFSEKYGVKNFVYVATTGSETLSKLQTQRASPTIDVAWVSSLVQYQARSDGLLGEFDPSKIPNAQLVPERLRTSKVALPVGASVSGLLHNSEIFKEKGFEDPTSWFDLWDERFKGHVGILSISGTGTKNLVPLFAKLLTGDPTNFDAAFEKFRELRPNLMEVFSNGGAMEQALLQGDLWFETHNNVRALQMKNSGAPIVFTHPKEGLAGLNTELAYVKDAPHPNVAHAWIDYMLSKEAQEKVALLVGYAPVNPEVTIPDDLKLYFPPLDDSVFVADWEYLASRMEEMVDKWNRLVEG